MIYLFLKGIFVNFELFYRYIHEGLNNTINYWIVVAIFSLAIIDFLTYIFKDEPIDLKSQIVSVGVLGTFLGVYIALQNFNPQDLKNSITGILNGLKIAFFTSIAGMFVAIVLYVIEKVFFPKKIYKEENYLKDLIEDFNQDIQTQFGTNFERFNQSITNLLKWQENYKNNIENTQSILEQTSKTLKQSDETLSNIAKNYKNINDFHSKLEKIIQINQYQIKELNRHLQTYSQLSEKAKDMFETIKISTTQITDEFKRTKEQIFNSIDEANHKVVNFITYTTKHMTLETQNSIDFITQRISNDFDNMKNSITKNLEDETQNMNTFFKTTSEILLQEFDKNRKELETIIYNFKIMQEEIPKALGLSLEELNRGLASLTKKFKDDYNEILNNYKDNLKNINLHNHNNETK